MKMDALHLRLRRLLYAERVTRTLCWRSGPVDGFRWDGWFPGRKWRASAWHRSPPLPFHSTVHKGAGWCRVCGQPIYGAGSFRSFAGSQSTRLTWHMICTESYFLITKPADYAAALLLHQDGLCALTGEPIGPPAKEYILDVEVDHDVPLFRVARDHADEPWYELIRFWGSGNLRALSRAAHLAKSAAEAKERKLWRVVGDDFMRLHNRLAQSETML